MNTFEEINKNTADEQFYDDYQDEDKERNEDAPIKQYDLTVTPNDFNVKTIFDYIQSGVIKIPSFQRNYVWDINRASKLIESLILGLPVPQIFLYEGTRNKLLVIDGQQRLISIYYFIKQRFPKKEKRHELRKIFDEHGLIPEEILNDDGYFDDFKLQLAEELPRQRNPFKGLKYTTLGEHKFEFELRPIRNVIVRQNTPDNDSSSIYEIFNRLNTGGINLSAQEIRVALYHSPFYDMLSRINLLTGWRRFLGATEVSLHMKDIEILLRGFAMLIKGKEYTPSLKKFLNQFSKECKENKNDENKYFEQLFNSFLAASRSLPHDIFLKQKKFKIAVFEAVFAITCERYYQKKELIHNPLEKEKIEQLKADDEFLRALQGGTTSRENVMKRLERARVILNTSG